ncbi:AAA family ATPase [Acuticoccus sp. M5D2P5]|uniref:AAA family ATPase n=1 Tax=Acuticoccus kalidii TaxID=2910977 RepID=UPI001F1A71D9|nr:AAA family ATPase [Acuticoccus kalidii]MCF3936483.1 AAA family ATPase [Acuticoccus kalidii]
MRRIVISGASGGGKSTLLAELSRRGYGVMEEPGRAVVREETARGGTGLPTVDLPRFAELAGLRALALHKAAGEGVTFFDRSVVDAVAVFLRLGLPLPEGLTGALDRVRYDPLVFMTPPWKAIYRTDAERLHGFEAARAEYEHLLALYPEAGYAVRLLPMVDVAARADFIEAAIR